MKNNLESNKKQVVIAATVASLVMVFLGWGYRVLAARLAAPVDTTPIRPESLQHFPLEIGAWTGKEVPLDEAVVRATNTDAHISRRYWRRGGLETVSFYVASGVNARDLMPHRPEVCYTGSGWTLTDKRSVELSLNATSKFPCNILQFSRGTLKDSKIIVLDYYLVDGQYCNDVSLLRRKAWRGSGIVEYVAQVQIATSVSAIRMAHVAREIVSDFAVESAAPIATLFEKATKNRNLEKDHTDTSDIREEPKSD